LQKLKIRIADYLVVAVILFLGLSGLWFNLEDASAAEQKYAVITVENEQVAELSLPPGQSMSYTVQFGDKDQHTAEVEVEDGRVRMLPMPGELCPKAICSHTGWIENSYESIVCLPNQIMINLESTAAEGEELDGVTN